MNSATPHEAPRPTFAAAHLLVEELALRLTIDILCTALPGFAEAFVEEAEKLLAIPLPLPDAQDGMRTLRDHVEAVAE